MTLEEELAKAREEAACLKAELQQSKQIQESFMACMSHELRTPLNSILGLTEALMEMVYGELNEAQVDTLKDIEQGGRDLLALINDILDLTRIATGDLAIEMGALSMAEVCQTAVKAFEGKAESGQLTLEFDPGGYENVLMSGDELRISQILGHLLDNAIKFTPNGGTVSLDIRVDSRDKTVHFAVCDTGVGIPKEDLPQLFKRFQQGDGSIRRAHSGIGLGLALVHQLAELHGGTVSVESEVGEGSRFIVSLPYLPVEEPAKPHTQTARDPVVIKKALVVEDSDAAANQLARYFAERGIQTERCPRGDEALAAALRTQPDVIALDIQLPGLFGWEVLERLKANPGTKDIPVMIVSIVDERQRAQALGAAEYLIKPINRNQLSYALCKLTAAAESVEEKTSNDATECEAEEDDGRAHILLAEDNDANVKTLTDYLRAKGYRVSVARDGVEAVAQTKALRPDIILMDIQMPNMNGIEAMEKLQEDTDHRHIPTIALTALAMPGDRERCLAAGACDYLSKPVSLKTLNAVIEKSLTTSSESCVPA